VLSKHADYEFSVDPEWDLEMQTSTFEMVLHGTGPTSSTAPTGYSRKPSPPALMVDDMAKCKTSEWESFAVPFDYYPPRLYRKIVNEESARAAGWRPQYTKLVIARAMPIEQRDGSNTIGSTTRTCSKPTASVGRPK